MGGVTLWLGALTGAHDCCGLGLEEFGVHPGSFKPEGIEAHCDGSGFRQVRVVYWPGGTLDARKFRSVNGCGIVSYLID